MGFLGDLKNKVTGGAATVNVKAPPARRGQGVAVHIQATAKASAKVNAVYLLVRAIETCAVRDTDYEDGKRSSEVVKGRRISYETKITVAGAQSLEAGQTYNWEAQLDIPSSANPSFNGHMIDHRWEIQAGLDMSGNDPDSGWQPLMVA
jgi:hypothetical protein